jgi:hypothetical protein
LSFHHVLPYMFFLSALWWVQSLCLWPLVKPLLLLFCDVPATFLHTMPHYLSCVRSQVSQHTSSSRLMVTVRLQKMRLHHCSKPHHNTSPWCFCLVFFHFIALTWSPVHNEVC